MVDLTESHYSTGTATVAAGGTVVAGQGTNWAGAIRPGDLFGTHVGLPIRILSVDSNTSLTLAHEWPGDAQTAAAYEIQLTPYDVGYRKAIEDLVTGIAEGNLPLFAALVGAANKLPYFDSADSMALADFPGWARSMFSQAGDADRLPYLTGANSAALATLTAFGRSLLDDADSSAALTTLGMSAFWRGRMGDADASAARAGLQVIGSIAPRIQGTNALDTPTQSGPGLVFNADVATVNGPPGAAVGIAVTWFYDATNWYQEYHDIQNGVRWWRFMRATITPWERLTRPTSGEITAGTATAARVWSPSDVAAAVGAHIPANVYRRTNIVGPVSQAAGVPTGAIIESGSTPNGSYFRYADGTQECWGSVTTNVAIDTAYFGAYRTSGGGQLWTFPVAFAGTPIIQATIDYLGGTSVTVSAASSTAVSYAVVTPITRVAESRTVYFQAKGRWF